MLEIIGLIALIAVGAYGVFFVIGVMTMQKATRQVDKLADWLDIFALSQGVSGNKERADFATVSALYLRDASNSVRERRLTEPSDLRNQVEVLMRLSDSPDAVSAALPREEKHKVAQYVKSMQIVGGQLIRIPRKG